MSVASHNSIPSRQALATFQLDPVPQRDGKTQIGSPAAHKRIKTNACAGAASILNSGATSRHSYKLCDNSGKIQTRKRATRRPPPLGGRLAFSSVAERIGDCGHHRMPGSRLLTQHACQKSESMGRGTRRRRRLPEERSERNRMVSEMAGRRARGSAPSWRDAFRCGHPLAVTPRLWPRRSVALQRGMGLPRRMCSRLIN